MRRAFFAVLLAAAGAAGDPAPAANVVGQAVQRLHLSPQQLLSLRDSLGDFNRGTEVEASGNNLFILRDASTMVYAGEFALQTRANGVLQIDRVSGAATLDPAHSLLLPLRLNAKSRAQVAAALAGSQLLAPPQEQGVEDPPAAAGLPEEAVSAIRLTDAKGSGAIAETRAVFFRDGSGWVRVLRAPLAQAGAAPSPIRIADRYLPPIHSDGVHAWRDSTIEIDSDVQLRLADLDNRYRCAPGVLCNPKAIAAAPGAIHFIRWGRQTIAAVPPSLLAQLAPQPEPTLTLPAPPGEAPAALPEAPPVQPPPPENGVEKPPGR